MAAVQATPKVPGGLVQAAQFVQDDAAPEQFLQDGVDRDEVEGERPEFAGGEAPVGHDREQGVGVEDVRADPGVAEQKQREADRDGGQQGQSLARVGARHAPRQSRRPQRAAGSRQTPW